jgi:RHS repeat-associated protein
MLKSKVDPKRWPGPLLALLCLLSFAVVSVHSSSSPATPLQCSYCITPASKAFASASDIGTVAVVAPGGCGWTATSNDPWIIITSGGNGTGDGVVNYSVADNGGNNPRTGSITVAGQTVTITQDAACTVRPMNLVAWWPGDGNANNIAGSNRATLQNGAAFIGGEVKQAFTFDGTDDYLSTDLDVQPSAMPSTTWEAWVYPTRLNYAGRQALLSNNDGGFDRSITIEPNSSNFGVFTGSGVWQPIDATLNQWQHIAVVYTATNIEFYKNGVRFSFNTAPTGQASTNRLHLGIDPNFGYLFKGHLDEVSIYNRALAASEIAAIYNAGVGGKCRWIDFGDVPPSHPFYREIRSISSKAITLGCGPVSFCPDGSVTREQMAAFIIRALGMPNPAQPAQQRFADVPPSNPFYAYIEQMAVLGITLGCGGGNYCPQQEVSREQMAAFIIRSLGILNPPQPTQQRFQDVLPSNPFYAFIDQMGLRGITLGCSGNPPLYCPSAPVTRGQMAAFLFRGYGQVSNQLPSVFAGLDQTIWLPGGASLSGMVNDDGLPQCRSLTVSWSKVSGPGTITFSNPNEETTTASFSAAGTYVLRLTANDSQVSNFGEVTITVNPVNPNNQPPSINPGPNQTITLPNTVNLNGTVNDDGNPPASTLVISWSKVSGPGSVIFSNASGATTMAIFNAEGSYVLRLTANDSQLSNSADVTITVNADPVPPPPDPSMFASPIDPTVVTTIGDATRFLYTGPNPIQTGVAAGTIKMERAAVLRGRVLDKNGSPLSKAKITVLNHPEFGQTLSRADGKFDLAVNGGGLLTMKYEKVGCLTVERQVSVPWQDYVIIDDVVMSCYDPQVTHIDLSANIPIQVAQGGLVIDNDGRRRAALLFRQGTTATMKLPDGSMQGLTQLHVRATEYTVGANGPAAMPGDLPATSAYTYAVDFGVDEAVAAGATTVLFSQPVINYLDNFLGFPVGTAVPSGVYDSQSGIWVPISNGLVVKILSIDSGQVNMDLSGSGQPATDAEYAAVGITTAERQRLASLYSAGQSLWRVPIPHFSSTDNNWAPGGAEFPNQQEAKKENPKDCYNSAKCGCIIECDSLTLGETLNITGTPFTLNYRSSRVPGRLPALVIPLSGPSVPPPLTRIELRVMVAGRTFTQTFSNAPNQTYNFTWDGKDAYGRTLQGSQLTTVRIGYVYDGVPYFTPGGFGGVGIVSLNSTTTRQEVTLPQVYLTLSPTYWDAHGEGIGGWTLNVHHTYDVNSRLLYLGEGSQRGVNAINNVIATVAGGGVPADGLGDGGQAAAAQLDLGLNEAGSSIAIAPDGSYYIADSNHNRIRRVAPSGVITTVAGNGTAGYNGDGIQATLAQLNKPGGVALAQDGSFYIADTNNQRIRKVAPNGIITTVAGNGSAGYSGDGGPATQAQLNTPTAVTIGPDGTLFIADSFNLAVRRVGPDGIITTLAGGGGGAKPTNGIKRPQDQLVNCSHIAVGPNGSLYICDPAFPRVLRLGTDGVLATVAGGGSPPDGIGDGGPATQAALFRPGGMAVLPDGSFYIADSGHNRVRLVSSDGIISTVAGNGATGFSGDGGSALQAQFGIIGPASIALAPDGSFYIVDSSNNRIRRIAPTLPGFTANSFAIPSSDGSQLYQFDNAGRHLRTVNALTGANLYTFTYDSAGRLIQITDGDSNITTIERNASGAPTGIVGPFGQRTTLTVDANGFLSRITDPASQAYQFTYTSGGLMTSETDPRSNLHSFTYDASGRLTRDDDPASGFKTLFRTVLGQALSVTLTTALNRIDTYQTSDSSNGDTNRINTNPAGLQTQIVEGANGTDTTTSPDGMIDTATQSAEPRWNMQAPIVSSTSTRTPGGLNFATTFTRTVTLSNPGDPLSLIAQNDTSTINGRVYTNNYAAATRTFTLATPVGRQQTTVIDTQGRTTQSQFANLNSASFTYDTRGRLSTAISGAGAAARSFSFSYNSEGYLSSITDPLTRTRSYVYDAAGRITQKTLPDGRTIGFAYDANGNLTSITPPGRPAHSFAFSPVDLRSSYTAPNVGVGNQTTYAYNLDRQLTTITRPDNQTLNFAYDSGARLSTLTIPGGAYTFAYSATTGNLSSITAPGGGTLTYQYDGALRTRSTWAGTIAGNVSRTFDNNFRVTSQSINGGNTINFTYDNDSLLTGAGSLSLTRNAQNGLISGTTLGNVTDARSYSGFAEVTNYGASYNAASIYSDAYTLDKLSRITQKVETIGGVTDTFDYSYDLAGRLQEVKKNTVVIATYTYDTNSNRQSFTGPGGTVNGTYDDQDRLTGYGTATYAYTANGELMSKIVGGQVTTYQYDVAGNLKSVTLPNATQIDYLIDGQDRRIGKKVNGTLAQGFLYQNQINPVAELDGSNNIVSRFVSGSRSNVPDYMIKGGVTYRIISDHLGSPRLVVDVATGNVAERIDYDEFGNVTQDTNPGFQPFGFAGGLYDRDTGLVRFGARDYDPVTGRWTAKDPILFAAGDTNLYGYVLNDPINLTDAFGLCNSSKTVEKLRNKAAQLRNEAAAEQKRANYYGAQAANADTSSQVAAFMALGYPGPLGVNIALRAEELDQDSRIFRRMEEGPAGKANYKKREAQRLDKVVDEAECPEGEAEARKTQEAIDSLAFHFET